MKIDTSALRSSLSSEITTSGGVATLIGPAPDPLLAELFGEVANARAKYEETLLAAKELHKKYRVAINARAEHKNSPDAVYTSDHRVGLVFSDAVGVKLQNDVKAIERELRANSTRSKAALLDYVVLAITRQSEAKARAEALARAVAADAEACAAAETLTKALSDRERYWTLAGQPLPGVDEDQVPASRTNRVMLQQQRQIDLKYAIERVLPFPVKPESL